MLPALIIISITFGITVVTSVFKMENRYSGNRKLLLCEASDSNTAAAIAGF